MLYIMGAGRSGSTLLERMLGALPGYVNVGELVGLFRRTIGQDERCGCGRPFSECPFWQAVGQEVLGGWSSDRVAEFVNLQDRVVRQRYLPRIVVPRLASEQQRKDLARWGELQERLYRAVAQQAGAQVVVDASKGPAPALSLRHAPGLDLRVLHLVRDVRGVAYSWAKPDVQRPHSTTDGHLLMASYSVARTAARWTRIEAQAALLAALTPHTATIRYEDLVADPGATMHAALSALRLPPPAMDHVRGQVVTLPSSHGIGGNPSRFKTGEVQLRPDEAWRTQMSRRDRQVSSLIGLPSLLAHRYRVT